ncbi:hypothetical protein VTL71DRAFT_12143, partial [Oculimacula yallundae]
MQAKGPMVSASAVASVASLNNLMESADTQRICDMFLSFRKSHCRDERPLLRTVAAAISGLARNVWMELGAVEVKRVYQQHGFTNYSSGGGWKDRR